jgi:hypothetical protein
LGTLAAPVKLVGKTQEQRPKRDATSAMRMSFLAWNCRTPFAVHCIRSAHPAVARAMHTPPRARFVIPFEQENT